MIELLEWIIVTYALSTFVFSNILNNEFSTIGFICIIYGVLNALLPMDKFSKMLFFE